MFCQSAGHIKNRFLSLFSNRSIILAQLHKQAAPSKDAHSVVMICEMKLLTFPPPRGVVRSRILSLD